MLKYLILIATALPFCSNAQSGYAAFALGYMPIKQHTGYLSLELTGGAVIKKAWVVEYNQNISLHPDKQAPKYIQVRTGPVIKISREYSLYPVAGYSITSVPKDSNRKIGHGVTAAIYLTQKINRDLQVKYELSLNNGFHIVPSIGIRASF